MLDRAAIAARIPHGGRMCLLDRVIFWDQTVIRCTSSSHRDPNNPLRVTLGLPAWAGIEYAAQASAVHGSLLHPQPAPRSAVLGALKNVSVNCEWLDRIDQDLIIDANLLHSDPAGGIYGFEASAGTQWCLRGQFTLMYVEQT